ncbi:cell division protein FtsK [Actinosynnema sp. ALI-1.44]|uniref:FtsK/SpoIIIE domain-containing protein n=1 Tax=Actinosynnema sp. ALI-1.44 TaxID=1933779 RepID=UPI00097C5495|nr:FtsK/SpoIIIE domain-containing protein [Actinosynnema sp. ALI-1.44]ONI87580.1 cell division protein FtsK [Actinosynnema sp. ALI-1.44]
MLGKGERRQRALDALDELRKALRLALGAARAKRQNAQTTKDQLEFEQSVMQLGLSRARLDPHITELRGQPALARTWDKVIAERDELYRDWHPEGPGKLRALVAEVARGGAGSPWPDWLGKVGTDAGGTAPELWRVGTAVVEEAPVQEEFPVAVPLLDRAHLRVNSAQDGRSVVDSLVESLLLRVMSYFRPGLVKVHLWDIGHLTGSLPNLQPLTAAGLLTIHDPTRLDDLLADMAGHIRRVHAKAMREGETSLRSVCVAKGERVEPWRVVVLFGNGERLPDEQQRELQRVARTGIDAGVSLICVDVPLSANSPLETIVFADPQNATTSMTGPGVRFRPDDAPDASLASRAATAIAQDLIARRGKPRTFDDLLPARPGMLSSHDELRAPVGFAEGVPVEVVLGDATPHALIAGPSGSGKTNFLYAMLGGLAARYAPSELELYLLDFKEGVSFAGLAPGRKDPSWLPQARLVGVNVNTDREFGLALLRFLTQELARRADAAKRQEVTKLAELREADPEGHWPRIVAVIDEFQALFGGRDRITQQATVLLEDVARRGRSQGIHLVLASQDIAGIEAFWGKPAVFEQCTLRIAMPKAKRVLSETNNAAFSLPRWHAVINHDSGVPHGNQVAHVPDASAKGTFDRLQTRLWETWQSAAPKLFDGAHQPLLADAPDFAEPVGPLLGQVIDVACRAATMDLDAVPGRNLAVIGTATADALSIMESITYSLARKHDAGSVDFSIWCAVPALQERVTRLAKILAAIGHSVDHRTDEQIATLVPASGERPRYILFFAVDAAHQWLERKEPPAMRSKLDDLRALLKNGPANHVHTFGWWRGVGRMKDTLGFGGVDDIGAWVALDVQGAELNAIAAGQIIDWSPRPKRAIFFDKSTHSTPDVIIPFDTVESE